MKMNTKIFECSYQEILKFKELDKVIIDYVHTTNIDLIKKKAEDQEQFVEDVLIAYGNLSRSEETHFIVVTNEQDELVGLCVYVMQYYEHALAKTAHIDVIFLEKEWRIHGNGTAFMKFIFENAKKNGAKLCYVSANSDTKTDKGFSKMFKPAYNIYVKEL